MEYVEISITTNTFASEYIAYVLTEITREGVSIYDKRDYENGNWDYSDISSENEEVVVKGYIPIEVFDSLIEEIHAKLEEARELFMDVGCLDISLKVIESDTWRDAWKESYRPIHIGKIVVCPLWEKALFDENITVTIDPGLAFGTGQHETTSSVINFLQNVDVSGKTVYDVGCGSGILGITALKLGAGEVLFLDNDEQAIECTKQNIKYNSFFGKWTAQKNNLLDGVGRCNVMLANLTVDLIKSLDIKKHLLPEGTAILSGILASLLTDLKAFLDHDYKLVDEISIGEWSTIAIKARVL